jgi:hypothetical protein
LKKHSSSNNENNKSKRMRDTGLRRHRFQQPQVDLGSHQVMRVTSVAHRFLSPGVVVLAFVPYAEDGRRGKHRPAVVVATHGREVTLIALTTSRNATHVSDVLVLDNEEAGLSRTTRARTARAERVDRTKVVEVLGRLSPRDFTRILMARSAA